MEDVRIRRPLIAEPLRDQRRTTALVAQYIHELSGRHAAVRRAARPDRARSGSRRAPDERRVEGARHVDRRLQDPEARVPRRPLAQHGRAQLARTRGAPAVKAGATRVELRRERRAVEARARGRASSRRALSGSFWACV